MLEAIPPVWGPQWYTSHGAVTLTRTGPNEIAFEAPAHMALVMFTPQPDRQIALNRDRRTTSLASVGSTEIVPVRSDLFARWAVPKETLLVALDHERLAQLAGAEFQCDAFELRPPGLGHVDHKALALARLVRDELNQGAARSELCLDAIVTLFAAHLLRTYSSLAARRAAPARHLGGLSPLAAQATVDHIRAHLADNLSIARLAWIAGLSPTQFLRAFRQSFGQAPHQYIVAQRVCLVERLVTETDTPLATIAKATGFSSHSHMTATVRRLRGLTPARLRRRDGDGD